MTGAHVAAIIQQAAKDARDVFSDEPEAKHAVDYMEQLIYAALRAHEGEKGGGCMTDDTPTRLYISFDRSGLTPRPVASFDMHPGADEWVPKETLDALRSWADDRRADVLGCIDLNADDERYAMIWLDNFAAALAALPAPPGDQGEVERLRELIRRAHHALDPERNRGPVSEQLVRQLRRKLAAEVKKHFPGEVRDG